MGATYAGRQALLGGTPTQRSRRRTRDARRAARGYVNLCEPAPPRRQTASDRLPTASAMEIAQRLKASPKLSEFMCCLESISEDFGFHVSLAKRFPRLRISRIACIMFLKISRLVCQILAVSKIWHLMYRLCRISQDLRSFT